MMLPGQSMCVWNKSCDILVPNCGFTSRIWRFYAVLMRELKVTNQVLRRILFSDKPAHMGSVHMFPWISWFPTFLSGAVTINRPCLCHVSTRTDTPGPPPLLTQRQSPAAMARVFITSGTIEAKKGNAAGKPNIIGIWDMGYMRLIWQYIGFWRSLCIYVFMYACSSMYLCMFVFMYVCNVMRLWWKTWEIEPSTNHYTEIHVNYHVFKKNAIKQPMIPILDMGLVFFATIYVISGFIPILRIYKQYGYVNEEMMITNPV